MKAGPELRAVVRFARVNLVGDDWPRAGAVRPRLLPQRPHLLRPRQRRSRWSSGWWTGSTPGGHLFLGHAESLGGFTTKAARRPRPSTSPAPAHRAKQRCPCASSSSTTRRWSGRRCPRSWAARGCSSTTASDPIIALEKMRRERPDVDRARHRDAADGRAHLPAEAHGGAAAAGGRLLRPRRARAPRSRSTRSRRARWTSSTKPRLGVKGFLEDSANRIVHVVRAAGAGAGPRPRAASRSCRSSAPTPSSREAAAAHPRDHAQGRRRRRLDRRHRGAARAARGDAARRAGDRDRPAHARGLHRAVREAARPDLPDRGEGGRDERPARLRPRAHRARQPPPRRPALRRPLLRRRRGRAARVAPPPERRRPLPLGGAGRRAERASASS